jgi:signal transduction histidine kinase
VRRGTAFCTIALGVAAASPSVAADGTVLLGPSEEMRSIASDAQLLIDRTASLDIGDVADGDAAGRFASAGGVRPNLGRTTAVAWMRVRLATPAAPANVVYLTVGWPRLEDVRVYWRDGEGFQVRRSGWRVPFSERDVANPVHVFRVPVSARAPTEIWVRVESRSELIFPVSVSWPRGFASLALGMGLFAGIVYGVIGALTVLNFLVFLRLRRPYQLYFVLAVGLFTFAWFLSSGYYGLFPRLARSPLPLAALVTALSLFFRVAFTRQFLRTISLAPRFDRGLAGLQWVLIPTLVVGSTLWALLWDNAPSLPGLDTVVFGLCFAAGVIAIRAQVPLAGPFTAATGFLLLGWLSASFIFRGVDLPVGLSGLSLLIGTVFELMVISWVLVQDLLRESRQRDETLRRIQGERLSALHGLVSGVVHELNTPLGSLRSSTDTLARAAERIRHADGPDRDALTRRLAETLPSLAQTSQSATQRISALASSLRRFARLDESSEKVVNIAEGLDASVVLLEPRLQRIEVVKSYDDVPPIRCRPVEMNQVFMSVLDNAVKAMPDGGRLDLRVRGTPTGVAVEIEDSGVGIPPDRLHRIFEPQLTARGDRVRLGLGLSTSGQIVADHNGDLEIHSEPGEGTRVVITLPREPPISSSRDAS